jgi:hypothetical protein
MVIKTLEWVKTKGCDHWIAKPDIFYGTNHKTGYVIKRYLGQSHYNLSGPCHMEADVKSFETSYAAMKAAQKDFETRVYSAFV